MEACPVCRERGQLVASGGPPRARACATCGGSFLSRDDAYQLIVVECGHSSDVVGAALATAAPTELRCPDCGEGVAHLQLGGVPVGLCAACGGAWLGPGDVERLRGGVAAPGLSAPPPMPSPSAAPAAAMSVAASPQAAHGADVGKTTPTLAELAARGKRPGAQGTAAPRRALPRLAIAAAIVGVIVVAALAALAFMGGGDTREAEAAGAAQPAPASADKYKGYFNHYAFGGRTVEWWTDRLNALRPGGPGADPRVYALTVERAERAGLEVSQEGDIVVVTLSAETTALLLKRLGVE